MYKEISINGIQFHIDYFEDLNDLLDKYLGITSEIETKAEVVSKIVKVSEFDSVKCKKKISNSLMLLEDDSVLYYFSGNLRVRVYTFSKKSARLYIEVKEIRSSFMEKILKALLSRNHDSIRLNDYMQAIRHALVFPYLVMMKIHYKVAISHGSAFCHRNKSYCILGYDGIGKSTLITEIPEEASVISDNFVIYNDEHLFSVPEPLRILGNGDNLIYGKNYVKIDRAPEKYDCPKFLFTYLGRKYSFKPFRDKTLKELNDSFWSFLPEFQDLSKFVVALDFVNGILLGETYSYEYPVFECERVELNDNKRALDELEKL